jgi:AAA15 family ATPase/GTPase
MEIENITLKNNQTIKLGKISILVGANNVGKSQTLRDIQQRMQSGLTSKFIILKEINFRKPDNFNDLFENLKVIDSLHTIGQKRIVGINNNMTGQDSFEINYDHSKYQFEQQPNLDWVLGNLSKFKVSHLDSSTRLNLINTTTSFNPDIEDPSNILQNLFVNKENEDLLKIAFNEAFGMEVMLDYSGLKDFCLRVAREFPEIPKDPREAYPITKEFNKIDTQGDGFRSFVGIVLSLLFSKDRIILLDESEAFLHPAQSRYLGKWIADNSDKLSGQIIISTHNANFLSGLLQSDKKVDIYRLNRNGDDTTFKLIPPDATENLTKSPMLSSQRVLEAIFHKAVIVCEADADRIVYQTVSTLHHNNQEILFVYSHNKQTLKDVASLLIATQIPVGVISDIDLLNDETDFKNLILAVTQNEASAELLAKRKEIADSVDNSSEQQALDKIKDNIAEFLEQLSKNEHTYGGAKGAINRIRKETSKWIFPKKNGIEGFNLEIRPKVLDVISELNEKNIFIIPVGELEGWMDLGTSRKNNWIVKALNEIFAKNTSAKLVEFVGMILNKVIKNVA